MNQLIILLSFLGAALAAPQLPHNFTSPRIGGKIVGGDEADIRELPYQAALLREGQQICGGAIIGPYTILTAAHCVAPSVISSITQLNFRVGSSQWASGGQRVAARQIVFHERYQDCGHCSRDYDIAVIHLAERINVPNAHAIQLVERGRKFPSGTYGKVSGWGTTAEGASSSPETLRKVNVPIVDQGLCTSRYGYDNISERMFCAGYSEGGKDSCQGDSGGPFAVNGKLAGLVSFGFGCGYYFYPGVYADIGAFRDWIRINSGI